MDHDDEDNDKCWRLRAQMLVWIFQRRELPLREAEQLVNSPEIHFIVERALNELARELGKAVALGAAGGITRIPHGPAARYPGLRAPYPSVQRMPIVQPRYVDPLACLSGIEPSALFATMLELVRQPNVEYSVAWSMQIFPPSTPAGDATAPVVNTEALAIKPEPAARTEESTPEPALPAEPELALSTEPARVESAPLPPKSQAREPPPEGSREGRPKEAASARKLHGVERDVYNAMKDNPPRRGERNYATTLWKTKGFKKNGVAKKTVQNYVSNHRKDLEVEADNARKTDELLPKKLLAEND